MASKKLKNRNFRDLVKVNEYLATLKLKDLKRECIVRGMDFTEVIEADVHKLESYFLKNFMVKIESSLLDKFDKFRDKILKESAGTKVHPMNRLGYFGEIDEETGKQKKKRIKGIKKTKKVRARDPKFNIFTGTAKHLTYTCQDKGLDINKTVRRVMFKYPDSSEKSIKIWYKRAEKANK